MCTCSWKPTAKGYSRRGMQGFQISAAKHLNAAFTEDVGVRALCREHQRAPNPLRPPRMPVMAGAAIPRKRRKSARRHQRPGRVCCTSEPMPPSAASTGPTRWCRSHKGSRARSRYALAIARAARRRGALRRTATASRPGRVTRLAPQPGDNLRDLPRSASCRSPRWRIASQRARVAHTRDDLVRPRPTGLDCADYLLSSAHWEDALHVLDRAIPPGLAW